MKQQERCCIPDSDLPPRRRSTWLFPVAVHPPAYKSQSCDNPAGESFRGSRTLPFLSSRNQMPTLAKSSSSEHRIPNNKAKKKTRHPTSFVIFFGCPPRD